jgi:hypothetical protein
MLFVKQANYSDCTHEYHTLLFSRDITVGTVNLFFFLCVQSNLLHQLYCSSSSSSLLIQKLLLENTVNLPLVKKFPVKLSYQLTFLKDIITKVFIFVISLP